MIKYGDNGEWVTLADVVEAVGYVPSATVHIIYGDNMVRLSEVADVLEGGKQVAENLDTIGALDGGKNSRTK